MKKILIIPVAFLFFALNFACGSPGGAASPSNDSPTEAYKRLYAAVKSKNTETIKSEMTKQTNAFVQSVSGMQNKPIEKVYENGLTATTFSETLPEIRDERINGEMGAVEVYNSKETKWEDLPFMLEDGKWKLAIGDMWKGTYKSPGKGRDQKEKDAANAMGNNNKIVQGPAMNANTMGMTANSKPNSASKPPANTK
jgi:hypothetical protein